MRLSVPTANSQFGRKSRSLTRGRQIVVLGESVSPLESLRRLLGDDTKEDAMKIAVDAGHGGHDSGAVGPTGLRESEAAFDIARFVRMGLDLDGHSTLLTRTADQFVSLEKRCEIANDWGADLFLSIHCNAFSNPAAHGYEVWTSIGTTDADAYAERLFDSMGAAFPNLTGRADMTDGDSDKEAGFVVLVGTIMPAVLVETAFISNALEERWLRDTGWKMRMAGALVSALRR